MPPTDTAATPPPGAPPPPPPGGRPSYRELRRHPREGKIAGVCAGVADYFALDPLVVRIGAIALAVAGPGIVVYVLMWIFVPATGAPATRLPRVVDRGERTKQVLGTVLIVIAVSVLWGDWWGPFGHWMIPLALIGFGAWLLLRDDDDDSLEPVPPVPPAGPWPWTPPAAATDRTATLPLGEDAATDATLVDPGAAEGTDPTDPDRAERDAGGGAPPPPASGWPLDPGAPPPWEPAAEVPPLPPDPERRRRRRWRKTISGVVMGTILVWAGVAALAGISLQTGLAVALCIVGIGFIASAFFGGSWGLLFPASLLAMGLLVTSVVDVPLEGPVGRHAYAPQTRAGLDEHYQVSVGELEIDLAGIPGDDPYEVEATVGIGHLVVRVPADATVELRADVGTGGTAIFGREDGGVSTTIDQTYAGPGDGPTITLDLELGVGHIDVERTAEEPVDLR